MREPFRRQGLAAAFIIAVVKLAHGKGMKRVQWNVLNWNKNAIDLYNKVGLPLFQTVLWYILFTFQFNIINLHEAEGWVACRLDEERIQAVVEGRLPVTGKKNHQ